MLASCFNQVVSAIFCNWSIRKDSGPGNWCVFSTKSAEDKQWSISLLLDWWIFWAYWSFWAPVSVQVLKIALISFHWWNIPLWSWVEEAYHWGNIINGKSLMVKHHWKVEGSSDFINSVSFPDEGMCAKSWRSFAFSFFLRLNLNVNFSALII